MTKKLMMGLDVGGTKIEGALAVIDHLHHGIEVLAKHRVSTPSDIHQFIDVLINLHKDLIQSARINENEISAIGIGLPGSIDPQSRRMINGNTSFLIGEDIIELLKGKKEWASPLFIQNDANLFTLAEAWGGVGLDFQQATKIHFNDQIAVGITLGTGVGGGLVASGKIYSGAYGASLEVGHVTLDPQGRKCYCSQLGCAETYLSGTALQKNRYDWTSKEIFEKYRDEDINAEKILKDYRERMLQLLRTLTNLFNPHYFVFGGGLSNQSDLFHDLQKELSGSLFLGEKYAPKIFINNLGDSAGVYGAMIYAMNELY